MNRLNFCDLFRGGSDGSGGFDNLDFACVSLETLNIIDADA